MLIFSFAISPHLQQYNTTKVCILSTFFAIFQSFTTQTRFFDQRLTTPSGGVVVAPTRAHPESVYQNPINTFYNQREFPFSSAQLILRKI